MKWQVAPERVLTAGESAAMVEASLFLGTEACLLEERSGVRLYGRAVAAQAGPGFRLGAEAVIALGAFDGLHVGHRFLVAAACDEARAQGVASVAVTFDPDPSELVGARGAEAQLLANEDRVRALLAAGVDAVAVLVFDEALAALSPEAFVLDVLGAIAQVRAVFVGEGFRFGHRGVGSVATLEGLGTQAGFEVFAEPLVTSSGETVSASRIRSALGRPAGLDAASELLGRWHFVRGQVEHGRGEGTAFGFPTANVRLDRHTCMPAQGVYGGYVRVAGGIWPAAINVGAPVSFSGPDEFFLEANLIGFSGDVYGADAEVVFVSWLRAVRRFDSLEELERTVLSNIAWVRDHLAAPLAPAGASDD